MGIFDTHAHLTDGRFDGDRHELIESLKPSGVDLVLDVACDVRDVEGTLALVEQYPFIYAAVGMHPHDAVHMRAEHLYAIEQYMRRDKVVALGEIGLDYHYDFSPRDVQRRWFSEQLDLAVQLDVPVVLHIREAFGDCMDILRGYKGRLRGEMHCFSGSVETAFECVDMGLYVAFGGALTFKNARKLPDVARLIPMERILIETDCPYIAPEPLRGRRNDPTMAVYVAHKLAELRDMSPAAVIEATKRNGMELFGIAE
ncbi:MAG: TatD family hydrolase [Clostridia bacterium]|nr:TatD family hydrolase [Clostridia bacterium]